MKPTLNAAARPTAFPVTSLQIYAAPLYKQECSAFSSTLAGPLLLGFPSQLALLRGSAASYQYSYSNIGLQEGTLPRYPYIPGSPSS